MSTASIAPTQRRFAVIALLLALGGCASGGGSDPGVVERAMQAVGISKPAPPAAPSVGDVSLSAADIPLPDRKVALRLHAGEVLNTDASGRSLSVIARVYQLKDAEAFQRTPYEAFQTAANAKDLPFAQDVVAMREIVLTPGKKDEVVEAVPREARFIAVVALFRAPSESRWRFVFDSRNAVRTGVTLGVHGCALSVAKGEPLDANPETLRLAGVRCR